MFDSKFKNQLADLQQQLQSVTSDKLMLEKRLEESEQTIQATAIKHQEYKKQIKQHESILAELQATHKQEMDKLSNSVNKRINAQIASIGVNQFASENFKVSRDVTGSNIMATLNTLEGQDRKEYYEKHKDAISRLMLKQ